MRVSTLCRFVGVDVGMGINPDDVQVSVLLIGGHDRRRRYRVVSTEKQRLVQPLASVVKSLVAILRIKLLMLHHVWLCVTDITEDVIVHVEAALFDSTSFLALTAHGNDWLEFTKFLH